jgi:hypothetical protein
MSSNSVIWRFFRMVPLGTPAVAILYTVCHIHVLDHGRFTDIVNALAI